MSARDDYCILYSWLRGIQMTGIKGDLMEIEVVAALEEIDRLRADRSEALDIANALGYREGVRNEQARQRRITPLSAE